MSNTTTTPTASNRHLPKSPPPSPPKRGGGAAISESKTTPTVVWGEALEKDHYLRVPKILFQWARYGGNVGAGKGKIHTAHILLILTLASLKFQDKPIRVYWEELAQRMGVSKETVRKWAYEARDYGLVAIKPRPRPRDPNRQVGYRNDRNCFDLGPIIALLEEADEKRERERAQKKKGRGADGGESNP